MVKRRVLFGFGAAIMGLGRVLRAQSLATLVNHDDQPIFGSISERLFVQSVASVRA